MQNYEKKGFEKRIPPLQKLGFLVKFSHSKAKTEFFYFPMVALSPPLHSNCLHFQAKILFLTVFLFQQAKRLPFPRVALSPPLQKGQSSGSLKRNPTKSFSNAGWSGNPDRTLLGITMKSKSWRRTDINTPWNWMPSCTTCAGMYFFLF